MTVDGTTFSFSGSLTQSATQGSINSLSIAGGLFDNTAPALTASPSTNFTAPGPQGGSFSGTPTSYTVQNSGSGTLNWTVSGPSWLTFSPTSGSLAASTTATVNVSVNTADAAANTAGTHTGTITFGGDGGTATRSATLTVTDLTPPTITGTPGNVSLNTPPSGPTATHTWSPPTAADNTGGTGIATFNVTLTGAASHGPVPAASLTTFAFPIGITTVTYTATDNAGNAATQTSFTVTVIDNVAPLIDICPADIITEATGPSGAVVNIPAPSITDNSGTFTLSLLSPPSPAGWTVPVGSRTVPIGVTTVRYIAIDPSNNNAQCVFTVTVRDTTPPAITGVPATVVLEATSPAGAPYPAYAALPAVNDLVAGTITPTASHPPGTTFPFTAPGPTVTTVNFSAADTAVPPNTATASFTVTVRDTTPPTITTVPANVTVEATGPTGAVVTYGAAAATDIADPAPVITYSQNSGTTFPIGTTTVTVTARDASNNASTATFTVTVRDTTPPVIAGVPANITAEATGPTGRVVSYTMPTATDLVTSPITVVSSHPPGSTFPVGVTTVNFTATDAAGNTSNASFQVTITDATSPAFAGVPANIVIEATGPGGAIVTYTPPTATDLVDGLRPVTSSHPSGSLFAIGTTTVTFTASDLASPVNTSTATFQVTVRDTTPPVIGAVSNITVTAPDLIGAIVNFPLPTATDIVDTSVTVTASPASGTQFPIGITTVTITAVDDYNNQSTRTFTVTVLSPAQMQVTPATGLVSIGPQGQLGGAFTPSVQGYTVTNNGQVPMDFTVTGAPGWIAVAPPAGTLAPGASTLVNVTISTGANALGVGVHNATIGFNNTTSAIGSTTRPVQLTVLAPAAMAITPATAFTALGPQGQQGGAFTPASTTYTVQNTGALPMSFTVGGAPSWVTLSAAGGTLAPGATQTITVSFNAGANALAVGAQNGALTFTNTTNAVGNAARTVSLNVMEPARLTVTPADGLVASGYQGGPFAPASKAFTLSNTGAFPLNYTAADNQGWLDTAPASGTIPPGGSTTVTMSVNASANALASGTHTGSLALTNATSGLGSTTRPATLTVIPNGQVVLKVVSGEGDGTFQFSSPTTALSVAVATSSGTGQSQPITLNPGSYGVTVRPPDGFGITAVTCSDNDSTGNASTRSANIALASAEVVTCTFTSVNSRKRTVEVISKFMGRRNDMLLSNGPDTGRQVDRLIEYSGEQSNSSGGGAQAGLGAGGSGNSGPQQGSRATAPSQLGFGGTASVGAPTSGAGFNAATTGQIGRGGSPLSGTRSFEERIAELRGPEQQQPGEDRGGLSPLALSGSTDGTTRLSFGTSLAQAMRYNADATNQRVKETLGDNAMALGLGGQGQVRRAFSPLDIWIQGTYLGFSDNRSDSLQRKDDGHFGVVYLGADYVLSRSVLIGALVQYDSMQQKSATQGYDISGKGWMAGPYATLRLSQNIFLQGRAAWGRSNNEVSPYLTYTDNFTTTRWLASSTLVGRWQFGAMQFRPSATLSYIEDVSKAYTDSLGVGIPSVKASLGQLKAGPQISYRYELGGGLIVEPRVALEAIWNFASSAKVVDFGGTLSGPEELRGRVELGVRTQMPNGMSLDISGSYDGLGSSNYQAVGGKAMLRVPLN